MGFTTEAAIRTAIATVIAAIAPTAQASVRFRESEYADAEVDFVGWCEQAKDAAFRRFSLRDQLDRLDPESTNTDSEWREAKLELLVAYPETYRYGRAGARARDEMMRADQDSIVRATGLNGFAAIANATFMPRLAQYGTQAAKGVVFLRVLLPFGFYRSVP